jgi:hypothetical protein
MAGGSGPGGAVTPADLAGAWRLVAREYRTSDGALAPTREEPAEGLLVYSADGWMAAQIMRPGRPPFRSGDRRDGTEAEIRAAYDGYLAYWGTFDLDPARGTVTHHVRGSLYPNWVGQDQVRAYALEGRRLILRTPPMKQGGREVVGLLTWERVA